MEAQRKRYCRHCGERIRHSAGRCPRCHRLTPTWKHYLGLAAVLALLVFLLLKYLSVF
jgi:predicted amidophosphoribosyltransferase